MKYFFWIWKKQLHVIQTIETNAQSKMTDTSTSISALTKNLEANKKETKQFLKMIENTNIAIKVAATTNEKDGVKSSPTIEPQHISMTSLATNLINAKYKKKQKRDIWANSKWKHISELENDDVGGVGEEIIDTFCKKAGIVSSIDGTKTKELGGGIGDGIIKGKTCEIKTARLGCDGKSFQHELGETPWKADFMIFLDIAPTKMYITIFPNFSEEFYKKSGTDNSNKCSPYFPTKSITWRKQKGAFKLDTSININEKNNFTFSSDETTSDFSKFKSFVDEIIH